MGLLFTRPPKKKALRRALRSIPELKRYKGSRRYAEKLLYAKRSYDLSKREVKRLTKKMKYNTTDPISRSQSKAIRRKLLGLA